MTLQKILPQPFFVCLTDISFLGGGTRKQIQDINWQRKNEQLTGGAKLRELESKYVCQYRRHQGTYASMLGPDVNICPSTAGWLWSVRTTRSSGPSSSWRTK